jgi:hypothetical protein
LHTIFSLHLFSLLLLRMTSTGASRKRKAGAEESVSSSSPPLPPSKRTIEERNKMSANAKARCDEMIEAAKVAAAPVAAMDRKVLLLTGLPSATSEQEIRFFLSPTRLHSVHLTEDGRAFVEVNTDADAGQVLARHGLQMRAKKIDITLSDLPTLAWFLVRESGPQPIDPRGNNRQGIVPYGAGVVTRRKNKWTCIRMRGLPWTIGDQELIHFFATVNATPIQVHRSNCKGEAHLEFETVEELAQALSRHRQCIPGTTRYVEIFAISDAEFAKSTGQPIKTPRFVNQEQPPLSEGVMPPQDTTQHTYYYGQDLVPYYQHQPPCFFYPQEPLPPTPPPSSFYHRHSPITHLPSSLPPYPYYQAPPLPYYPAPFPPAPYYHPYAQAPFQVPPMMHTYPQ